jgi:hypothetical protein
MYVCFMYIYVVYYLTCFFPCRGGTAAHLSRLKAGVICRALRLWRYVFFLCARQLMCCYKLKRYLTLLRHVQAATVDHQTELLKILKQWQVGDVLVCFSPDR